MTFIKEPSILIFYLYSLFLADDSSLATMEISDSSSQLGVFEFLAYSSSSIDSLSPELELLSQEIFIFSISS